MTQDGKYETQKDKRETESQEEQKRKVTHPMYSKGRREEKLRKHKENMVGRMATVYIFDDEDGKKVYF